MILFAFDFETTGVDPANDRVIEAGGILYSTGQSRCLETLGRLVKSDVPVSEEITGITGITQAAVDRFGFEAEDVLGDLLDMREIADALIGQNIRKFDTKVLSYWADRTGRVLSEKLFIDTMTDLPGVTGRQLSHMAADAGFLNCFPHSAVADCQTVIKLLEHYMERSLDPVAYLDAVVERAKSPMVIVQSLQARNRNADAKKFKFWWNPDHKIWWKPMKALDVEVLRPTLPFEIRILPEFTEEMLRSE